MPTKNPNVSERRRIPMRAIRAVAKQIADTFHPDKIILFGSYAYGKPCPESDVDLRFFLARNHHSRQGDL
jgi:predicted nucleotidyltransferase